MTLNDVTFADGGTASGSFRLNVYGYMYGADITTTVGTSLAGQPIAGFAYTSGGVPGSGATFDTLFTFNSTADYFGLALAVLQPLSPSSSGFDPLVVGAGSDVTLAGSYENCQQNATACLGPAYLDGRLITSGTLYAPEPATISLLGVGTTLLPIIRRRRVNRRLKVA